MNYRHAFHAGNFCDVLKHAVLALIVEHFKAKPQPFRVIDVHAGAGLYRLTSDEAQRTGEWMAGIGRLLGPGVPPLAPTLALMLQPYLRCIAALNQAHGCDVNRETPRFYPGSPMIVQALLRPDDRAVANELHPIDQGHLIDALQGDRRMVTTAIDAYQAIKANLPPPERRGVLLIDPPFEQPGEWQRMTDALKGAVQRFATGTTLLWYPRKNLNAVTDFQRAVAQVVDQRLLRIELDICDYRNSDMLFGSGLLVHNPPWQLDEILLRGLPELTKCLKTADHASFRIDWLRPAR